VVVQHDLDIFVCFDLCASGVISRGHLRVHIDELTISFILEENSLNTVSDDLRRGGGGE
jgi:hypothetical protein